MAWFKCSTSFLCSPAIRDVSRCGDMRSGLGYLRTMTLIWIMVLSIENDVIKDVNVLRYYGIPEKQAKLVWDECIELGILKETQNGFSAKLWMEQNGLVGEKKNKVTRSGQNNARAYRHEVITERHEVRDFSDGKKASDPIVEGEELEMYKEKLASLALR